MDEGYKHWCIWSFRLFAFIWQSWYWRIFTLVLVLMEHPSGISTGLSETLEMFLGLLRSSLTPSDLALGSGIPLLMSVYIQAACIWSATDTHLKMMWGGGSATFRWINEFVPPFVAVTRAVKFGKQWWRLLVIVQKGIIQHISYPPPTRWEGLTLLTVNYSQPTSPLRRCGLHLWSRIVVWARLAVFGEQQHAKKEKVGASQDSAAPRRPLMEPCARHGINWCLLDVCD